MIRTQNATSIVHGREVPASASSLHLQHPLTASSSISRKAKQTYTVCNSVRTVCCNTALRHFNFRRLITANERQQKRVCLHDSGESGGMTSLLSHIRVIQPHWYFRINKAGYSKNAGKSLTLLIVDKISPNFAGELGLCCILKI